jgi:preprotein translocase subunit YajC
VNNSSWGTIIPFVLIALVFWLLIVRPQRRRQQELSNTQSNLQPGVEVMLGSGIFGTVVSLEQETVHIQVAPGTTLKVARQAVVRVVPPATPAEDAPGERPGAPDDLPDGQDQ